MAKRNMLLRVKEFNSFNNCFSERRPPEDWQVIFGNDNPITLELGCGKAEISTELARQFKNRNFIGVDLKATRLWRPAKEAIVSKLINVAFFQSHILKLGQYFPERTIEDIWIPFPDPYPKARQAKHRMVNNPFIDLYKQLLKPGGSVHLKTDNLELFQYTLEVIVGRDDIVMHDLTFDLHDSKLPAATKIETTYERKFRAEGKKINYVRLTFK